MEPHVARVIESAERATLVFDLARLASNMRALASAARAAQITPLFAMKSFPCDEVIALAGELLDGFDAASLGELARVPARGGIVSIVDPTGAAIAQAPANRRVIVGCETVAQVHAAPAHADISIRVSASITGRDPAIGALQDGTGHRVSRFGVSTREQVVELVQAAGTRRVGLHVHHGPVTATSAERFIATATAAVTLLDRPPAFIDLGGAWHGIVDHATAFAQIRAALPDVELLVEPGRAYATGAGFAVGRVQSIRDEADRVLVTSQLSRACHLRWSQPELIIPPPRAELRRKLVVLGPTCYEEDVVGEWVADPAHVTERVVLRNVTGYAAGWNTSFGGVPAADVVFVG